MSKRISSSNVQLGESFLIGYPMKTLDDDFEDDVELSKEELYLKSKEKELRQKNEQILIEAEKQAASMIEAAQNNADKILEEVNQLIKQKEQELETLKINVFEEARQQGIQAGFEEGYKEVFSKVENLEAIANSSFELKKEIILSAEAEILQLSIAVAEKILKQQLEIKPEIITKIIKAAINELKDKEEIKIFINPLLKDQLYNFSEELKTSIKGMKSVKIIEDKTIHPNSAIVESPESRIDARLETQISLIAEELMKKFAEEPASKKIIDSFNEKDDESL